MTAVAADRVDLDVGRERDESRVGLASASIEVGKAHGAFPFLLRCVGGVRSKETEPMSGRMTGVAKCWL